MNQDNHSYTLVGGFVLLSLALLAFVLYQVTGASGKTDTYHLHLARVAGINSGSHVTFNGFLVGQVERIVPERENGRTRYNVQVSVRAGWPVPTDSYARIDAPSLLSEYVLEITEGGAATRLKPGEEIKGLEAVNIMNTVSALSAQFSDLSTQSVQPLLANLNRQISAIGPRIEHGIPEVVDGANKLLDDLRSSTASLRSMLSDENQNHLRRVFANSEQLSQELLAVSERFKNATVKLDALLGSSKQLIESSNALIARSDPNIAHAAEELRNTLDTVSQSMQSIVYHLESTTRNMNEFSRQLRDNPAVLLSGKPPKDKGSLQP